MMSVHKRLGVREDGQESEYKKGIVHEKARMSEKENAQQRKGLPSVYKSFLH